jgi:glycosyltransferase involved in cell wall biosynthesis
MSSGPREEHLFVVPGAGGLPTGGNVYNDGLLAALAARGFAYARRDAAELLGCAVPTLHERVWIDSLYLDQLSALRERLSGVRRLGLLLHALPSTLAHAAGRADAALRARERELLAGFDCALVTSTTTARALHELAPRLPTWLLEPAIKPAPGGLRALRDSVRALVVANLTPNKGVLPWLEALAARVRADDAFTLRCLGRWDLDPAYAAACRGLVAETPALAARVTLTGPEPPPRVAAALAQAHVLISASRFESFGMAIADARASGVVVLAHAGGHVAELVDSEAGGALLADDGALADAFLACVRERARLAERLARAAARPLAARSWDEVACAFLALLATHEAAPSAQ